MQKPTNTESRANIQSTLLKIEAVLTIYKNLSRSVLPDGKTDNGNSVQLRDAQAHISFLVLSALIIITSLIPGIGRAAALAPAAEHRIAYRQDTQTADHREKCIVLAPVYQTDIAAPRFCSFCNL